MTMEQHQEIVTGSAVRRLVLVLAVAALMAAVMVVIATPAFAFANPDNKGNAQNAAGQRQAVDNSDELDQRQDTPGKGGGPKSGTTLPNNADHFFQIVGAIGKDHQ
jgi:hypothetical protein